MLITRSIYSSIFLKNEDISNLTFLSYLKLEYIFAGAEET